MLDLSLVLDLKPDIKVLDGTPLGFVLWFLRFLSFFSAAALISMNFNGMSEERDANANKLLPLTNNEWNINNWKLCVWRSGRKPTQHLEGVSLQEGVVSGCEGVVSQGGVGLKEPKDTEGTGLNALWPVRWHQSEPAGWKLDQSDCWTEIQPTRWLKTQMIILKSTNECQLSAWGFLLQNINICDKKFNNL